MAVIVSMGKPAFVGSVGVVGLGAMRVTESIALDGTTTAALQDGEIAFLVSTEADTVLAAHGTTPNAAATAQTAATSAGYALPAGIIVPVAGKVGDKINAKAIA